MSWEAVQGAGTAVQTTQQTTQAAIQQVVQEVQAGFVAEQQQFGAFDQVAQAVQTLQGQIPDPTVAANQLNQLGQAMQDLQAQVQQQQQQQDSPAPIQQIGQTVQALQTQVQQMNQHAAAPAQSSASGPTPTPQTGDPGQAAQGNGLFQTGATVQRSQEERNFSTLMVHQHRLEGLELVWALQLPMRYNKVV